MTFSTSASNGFVTSLTFSSLGLDFFGSVNEPPLFLFVNPEKNEIILLFPTNKSPKTITNKTYNTNVPNSLNPNLALIIGLMLLLKK